MPLRVRQPHSTMLWRPSRSVSRLPPPLTTLPAPLCLPNPPVQGGGLASAHLHHARTVCRRAERLLVALVRDGDLGAEVGVFVNRLSDYLFVTARYAAMKSHAVEQIYAKARGLKERQLSSSSSGGGGGGAAGAPVR
jgi:hypothetical protein